MARLFDDGSSDRLKTSNKVVSGTTGFPFTIVGRFRTDTLPDASCIISISDESTTGTTGQHAVCIHSNTTVSSGSYLTCWSREGGGSSAINSYIAAASTTCTVNTWHSFVAVFEAGDDRRIFLDGANKGSDATAIDSSTGIDVVDIGRLGDSSPNYYFSGDVAEVAIYDYAFTDADAAVFSSPISPLLHRPDQLLAYWPIKGLTTEPDLVGGYDLTVTGSDKSAHPRVIYPSAQILQFPSAGAPPAGTTPKGVFDNVFAGPFGGPI